MHQPQEELGRESTAPPAYSVLPPAAHRSTARPPAPLHAPPPPHPATPLAASQGSQQSAIQAALQSALQSVLLCSLNGSYPDLAYIDDGIPAMGVVGGAGAVLEGEDRPQQLPVANSGVILDAVLRQDPPQVTGGALSVVLENGGAPEPALTTGELTNLLNNGPNKFHVSHCATPTPDHGEDLGLSPSLSPSVFLILPSLTLSRFYFFIFF